MLCRVETRLSKSHIISDAIYRRCGLVTENGRPQRFASLSFDQDHKIVRNRLSSPGTGFYERLLCMDCEKRRRDLENSFIPQLFDTWLPEIGNACYAARKDALGVYPLEGDFKSFRLFFFWTFWLAAISSREEYAPFEMTDEEAERLRSFLLADDPGPGDEFRCYWAACPIRREDYAESTLNGLLTTAWSPPENFDHGVFRMRVAGLLWFLEIEKGPCFPEHCSIREDGRFGVIVTDNCFLNTEEGCALVTPPANPEVLIETRDRLDKANRNL